MLDLLRTLFPRPVRIALYTSATGFLGAEVTAGNLPVWALAFATAPLLALLHLNPKDVAAATSTVSLQPATLKLDGAAIERALNEHRRRGGRPPVA